MTRSAAPPALRLVAPAGLANRTFPDAAPRPAARDAPDGTEADAPGPAGLPTRRDGPAVETQPVRSEPGHRRRGLRRVLGRLTLLASFVLFVLAPTAVVFLYLDRIAAPQFFVETQFAVRGADEPMAANFGLTALPGLTSQNSDSYIVQNYMRSVQVVRDIQRDQGLDVRQFYSRPFIDPLHRVEPDVPWLDFATVWDNQIAAEFNSITGNTTFRVFAFSPADAFAIASAVLAQAEVLVNNLSAESRARLIGTAEAEVARTEERLRDAQLEIQRFRNQNQTLTPEAMAEVESAIVGELAQELAQLRTRRRALTASVSESSPTLRVIDRQIEAMQAQIDQQRENVGSGSEDAGADSNNLAALSGRFVELTLAEEFGRSAYTAALSSLEAALVEARKEERYLATFIPPVAPEVSRHPKPLLYSAIAFVSFLFAWMVGRFLLLTVRDHAV